MIITGQTTIGTTPVQIDGTSTSNWKIHIHNMDNTDAVYIGNGTVTVDNGLVIQKLESVVLDCYPSETLFAVSTKAGHKISWLRQV